MMSKSAHALLAGDGLARSFRDARDHEGRELQGLASCLVPLLHALNWYGDMREIIEALPHFADEMDLVDLRNTLVALGYESHAQKTCLCDIDERLLPCLFQDEENGEVCSVLERDHLKVKVCRNGRTEWLPADTLYRSGTAYFFSRIEPGTSAEKPHIWGWFGTVLSRFKKSIRTMIVISLFTNLIAVVFPLMIMFIYDRVIGAQSARALPYIIAGIALVLAADVILRGLRSRLMGFIAGRLDYLLGVATFDRILSLPPAYTESAAVSTQLSRIKEFESLRDFFTGPLANVAFELPFSVVILLIIGAIAGPLALVPLITLVLFFLLGAYFIPRARQLSLESGQSSTQKENLLVETLLSMPSIKEAGVEEVWKNRYRNASSAAAAARRRIEVNSAAIDALSHALMILSGVSVLWIGTAAVLNGTMSVGALIATMILSWRILSPLNAGFLAYTKLDQIKKSLKQLNALMRLAPEGNTGKARLLNNQYEGDIEFNRVSFRYTSDSDPSLLGVSFKIHKGQFVSILGTSGAGKSTVLKLIAGLYQPQGGTVTVDGLDLRQVDPRDLRRKIAYVPQQPEVFYGTVAQNLRLSNPTASDEKLRQVTEFVGLLGQIEALPQGFETRLGMGQTEDLAPGFLQRLSIARALVREASILLLDEPGQSLDAAGDAALITLLQSLHGACTIVMVSHRPSHIRLSDVSILMNQGVVEFYGAPDQALSLLQVLSA